MLVLRLVEERFHRDVEGRPIREGRTPEDVLRPDDIEYRACPYPGARQGSPMNVSALRQTTAHWDEVLDALAFLRAAYAETRGAFVGDTLDIWRVSQLGSALPWFFILRDRPVPAYAAALSKATLGMGIWAQQLVVKMLAERWLPPPLTSPVILEFLAEEAHTLVGETEVCSAPDKMLLRFFDVLVADTPSDGGELKASRDALLGFGAHYLGLKLVLWIYYLARRFLYADVIATLGELPAARALLAGGCEPPDFFNVEPPDLAAVPLVHRKVWFRALANMVAPFAPDRGDQALRDAVEQLATIMGETPAGPTFEALAAEAGAAVARPIATYLRLDAVFAEVIARVEAGFAAALGTGTAPVAVDAAARDRLLGNPPRAWFASLAPQTFAKLSTS